MKCCATRWKPSKTSSPIPVITCHSQLKLAFGSCAKGLFSIFLPSKNFKSHNSQRDNGHQHYHAEERLLDANPDGEAGQCHPQAVESVNKRPCEKDDIENQDKGRMRQRDKGIPRARPTQQQTQDDQVQVEIDHQSDAGNVVEGVCPRAEFAPPQVEPTHRLADFRILQFFHGHFLSAFLKRRASNSWRSAMILPAGSTAWGQASTHSKTLWQRQTP